MARAARHGRAGPAVPGAAAATVTYPPSPSHPEHSCLVEKRQKIFRPCVKGQSPCILLEGQSSFVFIVSCDSYHRDNDIKRFCADSGWISLG